MTEQIGIALHQALIYEEKTKIAERETSVRRVVGTIISNTSIQKIKKSIVDEIGLITGADRCVIREYDEKKKTFSIIEEFSEFLGSDKLPSIIGETFSPILSNFIYDKTKNHNLFIVKDFEKLKKEYRGFLEDHPVLFKEIENYQRGVKGFITANIIYKDKFLGHVGIHFYEILKQFKSEDEEFLKIITSQIGAILYQAKLYEEIKNKIIQETSVRRILSIMNQKFDINQLKKSILREITRIIGADRSIIREYKGETHSIIDEYSEYIASSEIPSLVGSSFTKEFSRFVYEKAELNDIFIIEDMNRGYEKIKVFMNEEHKILQDSKVFFEGVKSIAVIKINFEGKYLGHIGIHFIKNKKEFSREDFEFLNTIASQAGIAFHQAKLYEELKRNNIREKFLSKVISIVKSSLDIYEIISLIYEEIKEFFGVNEVLSGIDFIDNCKTFYGIDIEKPFRSPERLTLLEKLEKIVEKSNKIFVKQVKFLPDDEFHLESVISLPVMLSGSELGNIYLVCKKEKIFKKEDLRLLENIADNIALAIRDSSLYTKTRFIADVSHELRTPIAIIEGYANNLLNRGEYQPEKVERYFKTIKNNAVRMTNIIESLMTLSNLEKESEDNTIIFDYINIKDIINRVVSLLDGYAKSKNIIFEFDYDKSQFIYANDVLIEQAVLNLVKNAIQYSESDSKVVISAQESSTETFIIVQDYGCGIEKHLLKNIFTRFYRVDKSRSRETGGSGLGLSIVEKILDVHNGRIVVESEPGQGSKFILVLPKK
jgi:signal transduction histidine kinase